MVRGLETFKEFFRDFTNRYVLIGGVAATVAMEQGGGSFRATKDFDLVLVIEALDADFGRRFWAFVTADGYEIREKGIRHLGPLFQGATVEEKRPNYIFEGFAAKAPSPSNATPNAVTQR